MNDRHTLTERSPKAIAKMYRQTVQEQRSQPIEQQWRYGAKLKILKAAYIVATEPQPI